MTSIVLKKDVTMLDIQSTRMLGQVGFLAKVFTTFEDLGISVDVVATSKVNVSLTLDPSKLWTLFHGHQRPTRCNVGYSLWIDERAGHQKDLRLQQIVLQSLHRNVARPYLQFTRL